MAFLAFNEGLNKLGEAGLPATWTFDLSSKSTAELTAAATYAGGYGVLTGTGYAALTQARPSPASGVFTGTESTWNTEANTNWGKAKSIVLRNGVTNLVGAWDLAAERNMGAANTKLKFTPVVTL